MSHEPHWVTASRWVTQEEEGDEEEEEEEEEEENKQKKSEWIFYKRLVWG